MGRTVAQKKHRQEGYEKRALHTLHNSPAFIAGEKQKSRDITAVFFSSTADRHNPRPIKDSGKVLSTQNFNRQVQKSVKQGTLDRFGANPALLLSTVEL